MCSPYVYIPDIPGPPLLCDTASSARLEAGLGMRLDILIPHCLQSFTTSQISCSSVAEETVQVSIHMCLMVMGLENEVIAGGWFLLRICPGSTCAAPPESLSTTWRGSCYRNCVFLPSMMYVWCMCVCECVCGSMVMSTISIPHYAVVRRGNTWSIFSMPEGLLDVVRSTMKPINRYGITDLYHGWLVLWLPFNYG